MENIDDLDIQLVLFDVDGVMTDGTIFINEHGEYFKSFNVKDGLAIELMRIHGLRTGIISGKSSSSLKTRCEQLGFDEIVMGCKNKLPKLEELCDKHGINTHQVAFVGDDVLDLPLFECVGLSVAPSDAHLLVLESATWVTTLAGGKGMVREFVDRLLCSQLNKSLSEIYHPLIQQLKLNETDQIEQ
ncbi:HAD-IIIA family hydrolase [Vibrio fluvialis]|nr:HAD-IIIA family hydrolase [Vibrio fluvialis]